MRLGSAAAVMVPLSRLLRPIGGAVGLAAVLFALRAPFMAASVDDLDSTNFLFGIVDYSPVAHRPHPPGFPVFIAAAKGMMTVAGTPLEALTLLSAIAGALAAIPLFFLARPMVGSRAAIHAAVFACFTPIAWFASVRPMSDAFGWCVGLTALAMLAAGLDARRPSADRWWVAGTVMSGLAIGTRLQLSALVLPLFLVGWLKMRRQPVHSPLVLLGAMLCWWLPMVWESGGVEAYVTAFRRTMAEASVWEPFLSAPSFPKAVRRLHDVLIAPWHTAWLAVPIWLAAVAGLSRLYLDRQPALSLLTLMFLPYALFNLLVHNTAAVRYVIPGLPLVAVLAAHGVSATRRLAIPLPAAIVCIYAVACAGLTVPALVEYHGQVSPPVQALRETYRRPGQDVVVSGSAVFDRYMSFAPGSLRVLSPAGNRGWLRVTQYWLSGGDSPVDFLLMPGESIRGLVAPDAIEEIGTWRWTPRVLAFMTGERPNSVRRLRITSPTWFLPANRTRARQGLALSVFVRGGTNAWNVLVQGRSQSPTASHFSLRSGDLRDQQANTQSFLLRTTVRDASRYSELIVTGSTTFQITRVVAADAAEPMFQPMSGFRRAAADEGRFHWLDPHATAIAHVPPTGATLHLRGQLPPDVSSPNAALAVRWNDETIALTTLTSSFAVAVVLRPSIQAWSTLTFETTSHGVPAPFNLQLTDISLDRWLPTLDAHD